MGPVIEAFVQEHKLENQIQPHLHPNTCSPPSPPQTDIDRFHRLL
jgi:hypothetical protein